MFRVNLQAAYNNIRSHEHPLRYAIALALLRSRLCRLFRIKHRDFTIRFHPTLLSFCLWIDPKNYRSRDHDFIRRYLRRGETAVDVGANIGSLTLSAAAAVGPAGKVLSIEADPRIAAFLSANCAANRATNVEIVSCAIGSTEGSVSLSRQSDDSATFVSTTGDVKVASRTLDSVLAHVGGRVSLLKIDVEGYELSVLKGAVNTLARTDCVYLEAWQPLCRRHGYEFAEVISLLERAGLSVHRFTSPTSIVRVAPDFSAETLENLVAVADLKGFCARTSSAVVG